MKVYGDEPSPASGTDSESARVRVGIADCAVGQPDAVLSSSGLGSCVGVALYDADSGVVGLAHAMLPEHDGDGNRTKYVDTAVEELLERMVEAGADPGGVVAKLAGGSDMFQFSDGSVGDRNVAAARETLADLGVEIVGEDVGGDHGRSLQLEGGTGDLRITSANREERTI